MTDKELLKFCKQHNVELSIRFGTGENMYCLTMQRNGLQIHYVFCSDFVYTLTEWDSAAQSKLNELVKKLDQKEKEYSQ